MTPSQTTNQQQPRTDPCRWPRADTARAFDHFASVDHCSQRQYAQQHGIPRSTLGHWLRREILTDVDPQLVAFLRCPAGEQFLRRLVLSALLTFHQQGACGIRLIGSFLELAGLNHFVASSYGALHPLATAVQTDLGLFADGERPRLAGQMTAKTITLTADENFHGPQPCLVAIEPVSNFLLVECYRDRRDGDTWTAVIHEGLRDLPVEVVLLTSDQAKGLLRCARDGLAVAHSPDLFHGQRDLLKPLLLPLQRPIQQAEKELEKARKHTASLDGEVSAEELVTMSLEEIGQIADALRREQDVARRLAQACGQKERMVQEVRGLGDDYHPFDRQTGRPVTAERVGARLGQHIERLEQTARQAGLGERAEETLTKTRAWLPALVAVVAWFWGQAQQQVEDLELSEEQEAVVYESLLAGHYWEMASSRVRQPEERQRLKEMAEGLQKEAWQLAGALASLPDEQKKEVQRVARQCAGLFSRSSSCVEGRNGRLSLHHHGQGRLSEAKLKALTVVHNYVVRRADGTTAAERFFGVQHRDAFAWLLHRLPDLPRPAAKRPQKPAADVPVAG
jgi:Family of unknown function (DUF6399)